MSYGNYSLEVISHHPQFSGKTLKKFNVDGIDTIGAWGNEKFEIKFKNHTWQKVQVKLSIDGTDILSGQKATTEVDKSMWVVQPFGELSLKAWPESDGGGAAFIFTNANNSVAVHTHGDLSCRGIIAAAVFVEGQPTYYQPFITTYNPNWWDYYVTSPNWGQPITICNNNVAFNNGGTYTSNSISNDLIGNSCSLNASDYFSDIVESNMEKAAAVGAGDFTKQDIKYVEGLVKPTFTETVRVKYLWWDELQAKLRQANVPSPHASGFPGDKERKHIDLGNTPRLGSQQRVAVNEQVYSRV